MLASPDFSPEAGGMGMRDDLFAVWTYGPTVSVLEPDSLKEAVALLLNLLWVVEASGS
ncbi:hypothetical protein GCM10020255_014480 [Rhodococcus baikonurensis]